MSTATYILSNGNKITFNWEGLNAFDFLTKVYEEGEALDVGLIPEVEIVSIHIKYDFPSNTLSIKESTND